jgi:hypothetical protein
MDFHGKTPDVVLIFVAKNGLLFVESAARHGQVDGKPYANLTNYLLGQRLGLSR